MRIGRRNQDKESKTVTTVDQLVVLRDQIAERRQEVLDLDTKSADLASTDAEASIAADVRARSVEKLISRLEADFQALKGRAREERIQARCDQIEAVVADEERRTDAFLTRLLTAAQAFAVAGTALAKLAPDVMTEAHPWPFDGKLIIRKLAAESFRDGIAEDLLQMARGQYLGTLGRVRAHLLNEARREGVDRSHMAADAGIIVNLVGSSLPPFSPEVELPEPEAPQLEVSQPPVGELALEGGTP